MKRLIIIIFTTLAFTVCDTDDIKNEPPVPIINPGDTPDNPITRIENGQLTTVAWVTLLNEIDADGKYVALDLSACTRGNQTSGGGLWSDGTFYPDSYLGDNAGGKGKEKIVSLVLPEAAICFPKPNERVELSGIVYQNMFGRFSALRQISGINITDIVRCCFRNLGTYYSSDGKILWSTGFITSIDFPNVITIGEHAFAGCFNMANANIPKVQIIKMQAFLDCKLKSLNIPDIKFIGVGAFGVGNNNLTEFIFGEIAPSMDVGIHTYYSNSITKTITVKVPYGATGYGEIPNVYIGGDMSKNWGNAFRGMGWNPALANMNIPIENGGKYDANGFGLAPNTEITLRVEYIP